MQFYLIKRKAESIYILAGRDWQNGLMPFGIWTHNKIEYFFGLAYKYLQNIFYLHSKHWWKYLRQIQFGKMQKKKQGPSTQKGNPFKSL